MEWIFLVFGIMWIAVVCFVVCFLVVMFKKKSNGKDKKKGDFLAPADSKKDDYEPFAAFSESGRQGKKVEEKAEEPSSVHANCEHAKKPTPYIDINDTYSLTWDEFKNFALRLLAAEYPSARISPYKYRGSPDIQLESGGKQVDVRLIHLREPSAVDDGDFDAALNDVDRNDSVADWLMTNGRFTLTQRGAASSKKVALYDAAEMLSMMKRTNISAKK